MTPTNKRNVHSDIPRPLKKCIDSENRDANRRDFDRPTVESISVNAGIGINVQLFIIQKYKFIRIECLSLAYRSEAEKNHGDFNKCWCHKYQHFCPPFLSCSFGSCSLVQSFCYPIWLYQWWCKNKKTRFLKTLKKIIVFVMRWRAITGVHFLLVCLSPSFRYFWLCSVVSHDSFFLSNVEFPVLLESSSILPWSCSELKLSQVQIIGPICVITENSYV